ncbi:nucleotidyltransferase family protein [Pseudomonas moraviensis subsp. stanleyae]|uniref:nucleotidyltransferase family protein n=1 Tax=Pseudomonas moraviensis TaxID=321662 RepID=UPI002E378D33|nr:nucleotidyltransferase family protein [Pseudomonas moraviensis]MED7669848.1 nucleotidyltransferase family protein [Pseudomonas moraviensis subsp. stanleyae]
MNLEAQLRDLITRDPVRMHILHTVRNLKLPDSWVAAGFVRSLVWDHLHQREPSPLPEDIDVIWFDKTRPSAQTDSALEAELATLCSGVNWSVKNQARMHQRNADAPYGAVADAMTFWPETATAVGVRFGQNDEIEVLAPLGLEDLFALKVRPTARFESDKYAMFVERVQSKRWFEIWPKLTQG